MLQVLTETVTPATLTQVLENLGAVMTFLMSKVGDVFGVIQSYPIALIPIGVSIAFVSVRFVKNILGL